MRSVDSLDLDLTLLAEESFPEMLAALDFAATFELARNELRVRATLAPALLPVKGDDGASSLLSVPPAGTRRKGRKLPSAFVRVEATRSL